LREAPTGRREVLGARHPDTLTSVNNLGVFLRVRGRYGEAEPFYGEALQAMHDVLGLRHPQKLLTQGNIAMLLVNLDRRAEAVRMLRQMETNLLGWIGQELYSTEAAAVRRELVSSQAKFQDVVLSLATVERSRDARRLAATVMLRFKVLRRARRRRRIWRLAPAGRRIRAFRRWWTTSAGCARHWLWPWGERPTRSKRAVGGRRAARLGGATRQRRPR
jgi:hypothetical protein